MLASQLHGSSSVTRHATVRWRYHIVAQCIKKTPNYSCLLAMQLTYGFRMLLFNALPCAAYVLDSVVGSHSGAQDGEVIT